ncbi:MAG: hypothetical protein ACLVJ6_02960 [Merdibacter sp.]
MLPIYTVLKADSRVIEAAELTWRTRSGRDAWCVLSVPASCPHQMVFMPAVTTFAISRLMSGDLPDGRHDRGILHHHEQPQRRQATRWHDGADLISIGFLRPT